MDVVGAGELNASPQGVEKAATLDERRGNGEAEEREPCDRHEVDPREVLKSLARQTGRKARKPVASATPT